MFQVRLPTGTVVQVQRGWQKFMNTVIYLSAADYAQTEGRDMTRVRWWGELRII